MVASSSTSAMRRGMPRIIGDRSGRAGPGRPLPVRAVIFLPPFAPALPPPRECSAPAPARNGPAEWVGARTRGKKMANGSGGYRGGVDAAAVDFLQLLGKAILSGVAVSLALALVALGLSTGAQAQAKPNDAKTGTLLLRTGTEGAFSPAPKVETEV